MKSELTIYLDYKRALVQARDLDEAASILKTQSENVSECCTDFASSWQGTDAEAYISKARLLQEYLDKAALQTSAAADTIRSIAEATYRAEKEALRIATARTYR